MKRLYAQPKADGPENIEMHMHDSSRTEWATARLREQVGEDEKIIAQNYLGKRGFFFPFATEAFCLLTDRRACFLHLSGCRKTEIRQVFLEDISSLNMRHPSLFYSFIAGFIPFVSDDRRLNAEHYDSVYDQFIHAMNAVDAAKIALLFIIKILFFSE